MKIRTDKFQRQQHECYVAQTKRPVDPRKESIGLTVD